MAFIGSPSPILIADNLVRITTKGGAETTVGLTAGSSGTIALFEYTGAFPGVRLPEAFKPRDYRNLLPPAVAVVNLQDSIQVEITVVGAVAGIAVPVSVVKTGTTPQDFLITLTNTAGAPSPTVLFELYIRFH